MGLHQDESTRSKICLLLDRVHSPRYLQWTYSSCISRLLKVFGGEYSYSDAYKILASGVRSGRRMFSSQALFTTGDEGPLTVDCHKGRLHFEGTGVCISKKMLSPSGRRNVIRWSPNAKCVWKGQQWLIFLRQYWIGRQCVFEVEELSERSVG